MQPAELHLTRRTKPCSKVTNAKNVLVVDLNLFHTAGANRTQIADVCNREY